MSLRARRSLASVLVALLPLAACGPAGGPAAGTLEVHVSDHRVAIGDFETLDITLTSIDVHPFGQPRTEDWLTFAPLTTVLKLTEYLNGRESTVLTTTLPAGDYDAVRLIVAGGQGPLKAGGSTRVAGLQEAAALRFMVRSHQTTVVLFDLVVQSTLDHPGGGYEMHVVSATTK